MRRAITGFRQDEVGDWIADLACGHSQHVRHQPPFRDNPWVLDAAGREERIGHDLECPLCDRMDPSPCDEGGEAPCFAHLLDDDGTVIG